MNSTGFILVKIEFMSQTTTIKAEPYKTLLEIKHKSLKILNDSKKNNLHLFYKNKDLISKEHEQIGNIFPKREKVFLTLMGPLNNPNYIKSKNNEIHREIKKFHFNEFFDENENNNINSSSNVSDENKNKNDNNDNNENNENQRKEGKKISIVNHKIVTKNKMIFSLMDNNKNKEYENINEQYKKESKHKKSKNNSENNINNNNENNENNNEKNNKNNENNENDENDKNDENKNNKKLKFNIKNSEKNSINEEIIQKKTTFSPLKSTRNPIKKKLFLKTFNLTNNENSIEKSQNNSINDIKNNTVTIKTKEKEEKKENEEDLQTKLNKRQEFNRLVKKSLTTKNVKTTLKKKSIENNNNNNNKEDSNNNNNNEKKIFNKNNFKSENKLAFNSILKNNILSTNSNTNINNNNNNKENKNKSTNSLQDFSNILTRTNKIKPSFLKSINQEINSMNFMCNCNNNKISFYCRICQDFLCYKCRESLNHQNHLAINIDIKNIENNISLYAIIIQNDIEEKILCNQKYYKSFKENKNYLYTENKNKILESKIKILTNIYNKLFGKLQEILKTKFVDEVEMILNEYNLNAKIIGGKIINILKQIEVFKQNKEKKKLTYEEFQNFFKILNEKEKELNNLEDNILLYKVNYELNEKLLRFYDNIERQLNLLININTPFNLNKKYIDFLKSINKIKYNNNNLSNYYTNYTTNFSTFNNLNGFNNKSIFKINNNNNNNSSNNINNNSNNNINFENDFEKIENDELFDEEFIKMNFINFDEENDENKITVNNKKNSILLNSLNNLNNKKMIKNKGIFKKNKLEKKTKKSLSPIDPNRNIEGKEKIINNSHINLTLSSPLKKKIFNKNEKINIKKI